MIIWLDGMSRAFCAFHRSDSETCLNYISKLFEICINECLLSVYKRVQVKTTNILKVEIRSFFPRKREEKSSLIESRQSSKQFSNLKLKPYVQIHCLNNCLNLSNMD